MGSIYYHNEDRSFEPSSVFEKAFSTLIEDLFKTHHIEWEELNYIFVSDEYLLKVNIEYLDHDYYTDIITFVNSDDGEPVTSDMFISIDRIEDNAKRLRVAFDHELHRVMIHGALHLCGINDKTDEEQKEMTLAENVQVKKFNALLA